MKKTKLTTQICLGLLVATAARADTSLTIGPANDSCYYDSFITQNPPSASGTFQLDGVFGGGIVHSAGGGVIYVSYPNTDIYTYDYTIDLSGMSYGTNPGTNHCVKLLIHFGTPISCGPAVGGDPAQIQSATLTPFGDVTYVFNGGCLQPGQASVSFVMQSEAGWKNGIVTVIDDYVDSTGVQHEVKINVPAIVPDVPPDPPYWEIAYYYSRVNPPLFQGHLADVGTNQYGTNPPPINGNYDFAIQLAAGSNGPAISVMTTQTVSVVNGLFTVPLPGEPVSFADGSVRYLNLSVRPSGGSGAFMPINPPLPITPTPQALYALSAGTVADIDPSQAVTSLNSLTGDIMLQAGTGIMLSTSSNTITISATGSGPSDRNLKTDIVSINPQTVLAKLTALPIESWRYTNEVAGIRHVGPMAQDFKAAFGLGNSDKTIGYLDASGVALAAVQGLNQKLTAELQRENAENVQLRQQLIELQRLAGQLNQKLVQNAK
jgi:Chaperone of endosialidase